MTLAAILRALLTGDRVLRDSEWVTKAVAFIDAHEADAAAAAAPPATTPEVTT